VGISSRYLCKALRLGDLLVVFWKVLSGIRILDGDDVGKVMEILVPYSRQWRKYVREANLPKTYLLRTPKKP